MKSTTLINDKFHYIEMKSEYPQWVVLQTAVRKMILNHEYH